MVCGYNACSHKVVICLDTVCLHPGYRASGTNIWTKSPHTQREDSEASSRPSPIWLHFSPEIHPGSKSKYHPVLWSVFINKVPFLVTVSDHIKFTTAEHIKTRSTSLICDALLWVVKIYQFHGFVPHTALMDGEFAPLSNDLHSMGMRLNIAAANEHVPKIERQIRVVKEHVRCIRHTLPFSHILVTMLIQLVYHAVMWLNSFPPKGGVSSTISPRSLMTGVPLDYKKHCQLHFGSYAQTHEEPDPTNTPNTRTVGAICLGPTGNLQGSHKFFSLQSRKLITCHTWTALPMPQEVIDRVNAIGLSQDQPKLLTFYDCKGELVGDLVEPPYETEVVNVTEPDIPVTPNVDKYDPLPDEPPGNT